ncbi:hypothetical protein [Mycobacterium sp. 1245805.9]|uniref:hypothetical protein n=1 Tax=Mycobacterium sp. 1245805.9 TaxID=1856862 RepID=UPI000801E976|nr:hypothetical protein [Mycobacterium sp. 1245805.9]OBI80444.1 hypothetical protein A9X00_11265 [Mycobacterium sp. 1245805.9]
MTKAWAMMIGGFVLFCAGFPAMLDWSRYWWCLAFYLAGLALLILGRRQHDLVSARAGQERLVAGSENRPDAPIAEQPPSRRKAAVVLAWIGVVLAFLAVLAGLRLAEQGALPEVLDSGTPARATVVKCAPSQYRGTSGYRCDVTWSVGGTTHTGPLYPLAKWSGGWTGIHKDPPAVGSQLDVRVRGDRAYEPANRALDASFIAGGLAVIAAGVVLFLYLRRRFIRRSAR